MSFILKAEGITKKFGDLVANDNIDIEVGEGELHCLVGENGAGKSTLLNVLYGVWERDAGRIFVKGEEAKIKSTHDAITKYKIGKVSQHSDLVPDFTVSENILYRETPTKNKFFIDRGTMREKVLKLLSLTGFKIDPDAVVETLSVGEQQQVEILKVLCQDAEIIFLDEPSALLAPQEVKQLFKLARSLTEQGRSIVFVTHKLNEVMECDRITVLRNGKVTLKEDRNNLTQEALVTAMFGERVEEYSHRVSAPDEGLEPVLEVRDLCTGEGERRSELKNVSFILHQGEILGIAGVVGNGQRELLNCLTGFLIPTKGQILLKGRDITRDWLPSAYRKHNMLAYVPEGRREMGSLLELPLTENMILGEGRRSYFFPNYIRHRPTIEEFSSRLVSEYDVETTGIYSPAGSLSGGNLQKQILARELTLESDLLIVAQPTRGLDFKTTEFIYKSLSESKQGKGILLVSTDLDEIMKLSDRIAVMYEGRLIHIPCGELNIGKIGRIMIGMDETNDKKSCAINADDAQFIDRLTMA